MTVQLLRDRDLNVVRQPTGDVRFSDEHDRTIAPTPRRNALNAPGDGDIMDCALDFANAGREDL